MLHSVDAYVGKRLRSRRRDLAMSQAALAAHLGLTFQQVQKYESGQNRISASMLFLACGALGVGVDYFFEDAGDDALPTASETSTAVEFSMLDEAAELAAAFPKITSPKLRRRVLDIVRAVASGY